MSLEQLTELFKWMTIIDIGLLIFTSLMIMGLKGVMTKMHGRMFGISESQVAMATYCYLGAFKIFVILFNIVPYIALNIIQ
jgi:hypothetical protein